MDLWEAERFWIAISGVFAMLVALWYLVTLPEGENRDYDLQLSTRLNYLLLVAVTTLVLVLVYLPIGYTLSPSSSSTL